MNSESTFDFVKEEKRLETLRVILESIVTNAQNELRAKIEEDLSDDLDEKTSLEVRIGDHSTSIHITNENNRYDREITIYNRGHRAFSRNDNEEITFEVSTSSGSFGIEDLHNIDATIIAAYLAKSLKSGEGFFTVYEILLREYLTYENKTSSLYWQINREKEAIEKAEKNAQIEVIDSVLGTIVDTIIKNPFPRNYVNLKDRYTHNRIKAFRLVSEKQGNKTVTVELLTQYDDNDFRVYDTKRVDRSTFVHGLLNAKPEDIIIDQYVSDIAGWLNSRSTINI
jgi:hypothetical protein